MKSHSFVTTAGGLCLAFIMHIGAAGAAGDRVLHSFGSGTDGSKPLAGLAKMNGMLYGTTAYGGTGNCRKGCGTVFVIDPVTGTETVLHAFSGADGREPTARLMPVKGELYGTTVFGGTYDAGTAFAINPKNGAEKLLHSYSDDGTDGVHPYDGLVGVKGALYGTTELGGSYDRGTVFSIVSATGSETVLHSFSGDPDGQYPYTGLIDANGKLYGTTAEGGTYGWGTAFALNLRKGRNTTLHSFGAPADGQHPYAALTNIEGTLYGTTEYGGTNGYGTVYALNLATGIESVIHSFAGGTGDGNQPVAALLDVRGVLYGTTKFGGLHGAGTAFKVDTKSGAATLVYSFGASTKDAASPYAALIEANGTLYGTTDAGGTHQSGTVFAITP